MTALIDAFIPAAHAAESGGGDGMTPNPYSSALGPLQFTDQTYNDAVAKYGKKYGFDASGRNTMEGQTKATQALSDNEYTPFLASHGIRDPAPHDIYQMHLWGQPNMEKLLTASPDTPLRDALGSSFDAVHKGNGRLWGNNPNATVEDAMTGVANYFDTGAAAPLPQGKIPPRVTPPSVAVAGSQMGAQPGAIDPNVLAQMTAASPAGPATAQAVAQQQPGNFGQNTSQALLRMAQGAAGKMNWGSALGGAAGGLADAQDQNTQQGMAMQGLQQKQHSLQIEQQDADTKRMQARGMVADRASGLIQAGIPPAQAMQIAMAPFAGGDPSMAGGQGGTPDLSGLKSTGGKGTAGEFMVAPDGTHFQSQNHPFGPPTFVNMNTGEQVSTIPPGTMRPQDSYYKTLSGDDAKAESKGANDAIQAQKDLGVIQSFKDIIPSVNAGGDLVSTVKRNFANVFGLPEAAAQGAATQLMADMQTARVKMFQGLGPIRKGELDMLKASGANWQQQPAVLNMIADFMGREKQDQIDKYDAWRKVPPSQRGSGYRDFEYNYQSQNKPAAPDVSGVVPSAIMHYDAQGNRIK